MLQEKDFKKIGFKKISEYPHYKYQKDVFTVDVVFFDSDIFYHLFIPNCQSSVSIYSTDDILKVMENPEKYFNLKEK